MNKKKILLLGAFSRPNFGDVLLARLFHDLFVMQGFDVYFSFNATAVVKECGFKRIDKMDLFKIDYAFYIGGGYFSEPPGSATKWAISRYIKLFYMGGLLKLISKKYSIIGVGAGPINGFFSRLFIRNLVKNSEAIIVRDIPSQEALKKLIDNKNIEVGADLVLNLKDIISFKYTSVCARKIALHLSPNRDDINFQILDFFKEKDAWIIEDHTGTLDALKNKYPIIMSQYCDRLIEYKGHQDFIGVLNSFDFILTSKLHVGIVSAVLGKRICSFPYHKKVSRFYDEIGRADLCLEDVALTQATLHQHIEYCLNSNPVCLNDFNEERKNKIILFLKQFSV